jgi:sec-independent protein translocase protein TatA
VFGDILQPTHLIFILAVALLVLGPKRLPEVGRSLGKGIRDFRGALSGLEEQTADLRTPISLSDPVPPAPVTPATVAPVESTVVATSEPPAFDVPTQATVALDARAVEVASVKAPQFDEPHPSDYAD